MFVWRGGPSKNDGKSLKRDGRFVIGDWPAIKERFLGSRDKIQAAWRKMTFPPRFEGRIRGAGLVVQRDTVDVVRGDGTGY